MGSDDEEAAIVEAYAFADVLAGGRIFIRGQALWLFIPAGGVMRLGGFSLRLFHHL